MSSSRLSLLFRLRPLNFRFIHRSWSFQQYRPIIILGHPFLGCQSMPQHNLTIKRFKKTVKRSLGNDDVKEAEADDDDDDADLAGENPMLMDDLLEPSSDGSKRTVIDVGTLRLDGFAKTAFSMTRIKIEELFYKGDIYINGERPSKKSCDLSKGDEIDIVLGVNEEDRSLVDVKRVQIVELPDKATDQGRMKITIDKWERLSVKAYNQVER